MERKDREFKVLLLMALVALFCILMVDIFFR